MEYKTMKLRFDIDDIISLTIKQIEHNFFPLQGDEKNIIKEAVILALDRCNDCFKECNNKYYKRDGIPYFNPIHSGQNTVFLYFLSNILWKNYNNSTLADYVYYLNKIMNGVDIFYEVELPSVMFFEHPVGTVLGRATYNDRFLVYQNCTIGVNNGKHPVIGSGVSLLPYACILGDCKIGDNCIIASHAYIKDQDIPNNSIVFGFSPNLIIKPIGDKYINVFN